ncbi:MULTISPECIES: hypothetical protein [unclassified Kitasatospora]|uniref:hypothetical protein n=1 Tax=unclassified Kitasatospora TaxID=2633591 RepID=UPI00364A18B3
MFPEPIPSVQGAWYVDRTSPLWRAAVAEIVEMFERRGTKPAEDELIQQDDCPGRRSAVLPAHTVCTRTPAVESE